MEMGEMKREGFTLVELLVVIAILGILLAMMVPAAGVIMKKAKNSQAQADLGVVQGALMKYRMEYNRWPDVKAVHGGYAGTSERWVEIMNPDVTTGSGKRDADNFRQLRFLEIGKGMVADSGRYKGAFCDPWTHDGGGCRTCTRWTTTGTRRSIRRTGRTRCGRRCWCGARGRTGTGTPGRTT